MITSPPPEQDTSTAKEITLGLCIILALYGIVFEGMFLISGYGSWWSGLFLLIPAATYFSLSSSVLFFRWNRRHSSRRKQRQLDQKTLNTIKELVTSSTNPTVRLVLQVATLVEDQRSAFAWLTKAFSSLNTLESETFLLSVNKLSTDSSTRRELFNLINEESESFSSQMWTFTIEEGSNDNPLIVVNLLSEVKSSKVARFLLQFLSFPDPRVRMEAVSALRSYSSDETMSALLDITDIETDEKVERNILHYFYLNRESVRDSDKRLAIFDWIVDRWWDWLHQDERCMTLIRTILPSLSTEKRSDHFSLMLDLLSHYESPDLDEAILQVLESDHGICEFPTTALLMGRQHLIRMRNVFRRNPDRKTAFNRFQKLFAHGNLIGFAQTSTD